MTAETTASQQSARPMNLQDLLSAVEPENRAFRTTSGNRVVYLGKTESGLYQFVGRKLPGFLSIFIGKDEYVVAYESLHNNEPHLTQLDYAGEIPRGERGRYPRLNQLLINLGVPELK